MKTYTDFLKQGVEGYTFREVVDNLDEEQFQSAAEAYHRYRMEQYKEQGMILLPDKLTAENGAKELLIGEFIEDIQLKTNHILKHAVYWTTIKDIYKTVVDHFHTEKDWYCRKEVNKGIRCNNQCGKCKQDDPKNKHL